MECYGCPETGKRWIRRKSGTHCDTSCFVRKINGMSFAEPRAVESKLVYIWGQLKKLDTIQNNRAANKSLSKVHLKLEKEAERRLLRCLPTVRTQGR